MTIDEKIVQLRHTIQQQLQPLVQSDYVLWGLPYHENIGDTLIWQGELAFLKQLPFKCIGTCGWNRLPQQGQLPQGTTLLLHGGGFMGDVWREAWNSMLTRLSAYAHHPIVLLPNTLYYSDEQLMVDDAKRLAQFSQLTICLRDQRSYQLAQAHFSNPVLLVPDMAFCVSTQPLRQMAKTANHRGTLLLKRNDKEATQETLPYLPNMEQHDWPTVGESLHWQDHTFDFIQRITSCAERRWPLIATTLQQLESLYAYHIYRNYLIHSGVKLLTPYQHIITTRLHGMILSMLLNKPVSYIDNSYGKLSAFYNTWLSDVDNVTPWP